MKTYGGIELGGTKIICAVGTGPDDIGAECRIPTTDPVESLRAVVGYFQTVRPQPAAIGIASFGPLDLQPGSRTFGHITRTPKSGWSWVDVAGTIARELGLPVLIDTDVNGAALAEHRWGAAQGLSDFVYVTVGTGIGGGAMVEGRLLHGLSHPEMGHLYVPHDREADPFAGICPYHGDCLEGLASGPAIRERWGRPAETLPANHEAWAFEAQYLGLLVANVPCVASPQRVVFGGGVMQQEQLLPLVRTRVRTLMNGYPHLPSVWDHLDRYVVPAGLGQRAGILGALAMAQHAKSD